MGLATSSKNFQGHLGEKHGSQEWKNAVSDPRPGRPEVRVGTQASEVMRDWGLESLGEKCTEMRMFLTVTLGPQLSSLWHKQQM